MILLLTWLIYPVLEAITQGLLFKYKKGFGHVKGDSFYLQLFLIRGIAFILWGILVMDAQVGSFLPLLGYAVGCHFAIFDILLNCFRSKPWDYEGENSGWLKGIPMFAQLIISGGLIYVSLVVLNAIGYFN